MADSNETAGGELITTKTGAPPLSDREAKEFAELSHRVVEKLGFFVEVGLALQRIRDSRLYREDYYTFEEYVKAAFDMSARRSEQLRRAALAYEQIRTNCSLLGDEPREGEKRATGSLLLPQNEGQARALLQAPEEKRAEVWLKTIEKAKDGKVTARQVTSVIREEIGTALKEEKQKLTREPRDGEKELYPPFVEAFNAFWQQITDAYMDGWKKVPRKEVVKRLESILRYIKE